MQRSTESSLPGARRRLARIFLPVLGGARAMAGDDAPRLAAVGQFERAVTALQEARGADLRTLAAELEAEPAEPPVREEHA